MLEKPRFPRKGLAFSGGASCFETSGNGSVNAKMAHLGSTKKEAASSQMSASRGAGTGKVQCREGPWVDLLGEVGGTVPGCGEGLCCWVCIKLPSPHRFLLVPLPNQALDKSRFVSGNKGHTDYAVYR